MSESVDCNWEECEPFDIDNGELDGLTLVQAFVLGVEWQMVSAQLDSGEAFGRPIHPRNADRLKRQCIRRERNFTVKPNGPDWLWLEVTASGD